RAARIAPGGRRGSQIDEPVVVVRSPRGRRHGRCAVHSGCARTAGASGIALRGGAMSDTRSTTLLIIGGGPGGYVAAIRAGQLGVPVTLVRSEEHTSELQSRENLVCRLLLEKKNSNDTKSPYVTRPCAPRLY